MARRVSGVLTVAGGVVLAVSLLGFLGSLAWWLDLLANFKLQFAIVLAVLGIALMAMGRTAAAAAMLAGALLNAAVIAPLYYRSPADPAVDGPVVTLASFNIQIGNRLPRLTWVLQDDPDLVFLFETARVHFDELEEHVPDYEVISGIFDTRDYGATILAREPVEVELLEIARQAGDAVRVELPVGDGIVVVYGIHPPNPTNARDARFRDELLAEVGRMVAAETEPVIVIGDLNATPWSEGFRLLTGPADLANSQEGFGYAASWPARLPPFGRIPIDHALHSRDLTVTDRELGPGTAASDHRPLRVILTTAATDDRSTSEGRRRLPAALPATGRFTPELHLRFTTHLPIAAHPGRMTENTTLVGSKVSGRRRRPKAVDGVRICSDMGCETRLSRYNRNGTCYMHSPIVFPRVRGRDVPVVDV